MEREKIIERVKTRGRDKIQQIDENYSNLVLVTFLFSTGLMLFQHTQGWSWDFNVYSMIGQYIFHDGIYMEWLRPPVASVIIGLFQYVFSRKVSEYLFIVASSTVFLYASRRVSEAYDLDLEAFYIFLMTPAAVFYSTMAGTEILSLAFAMLFFADLDDAKKSGLWLGFAFLTRYNYGLLIPLTFLQKDLVKTIKTGIISGLTLVPWLAYNYLMTGNPITSFANFLMLNVFMRSMHNPVKPMSFLIATLPTCLILLAYLKSDVRERLSLNLKTGFVLGFTVLVTLSYVSADLKSMRYLYPLIFPTAFFAAKAWKELSYRKILIGLLAFNMLFGAAWISEVPLNGTEDYRAAANSMDECMLSSSDWVHMNYAGVPTVPESVQNITEKRLDKGYRLLRFKGPNWEIRPSTPVFKETDEFIIYGDPEKCIKTTTVDSTYLDRLNERTGLNYTLRGYLYRVYLKEKVEALS